MTEEEAIERWPDLDPKERARRKKLSEQATARHQQVVDPQTGRRAFGGVQPNSGRPRKRRVAEEIAELAQGRRKNEVIQALFSGLSKTNSAAVRSRVAEKIIKIEHQERELQMAEAKFDDDPKDALIVFIAPILAGLLKKGDLGSLEELLQQGQIEQRSDAETTAVEIT